MRFEPERDPLPPFAFMLDGRSVPDRGVQSAVVEPADVADGRVLELRVGAVGGRWWIQSGIT